MQMLQARNLTSALVVFGIDQSTRDSRVGLSRGRKAHKYSPELAGSLSQWAGLKDCVLSSSYLRVFSKKKKVTFCWLHVLIYSFIFFLLEQVLFKFTFYIASSMIYPSTAPKFTDSCATEFASFWKHKSTHVVFSSPIYFLPSIGTMFTITSFL